MARIHSHGMKKMLLQPIKEIFWQVAAKDQSVIYGVTNAREGNKSAVVFVHGLTRDMNEPVLQQAADFFPQHGYDAIRFNLYSSKAGGRDMASASIADYAADLNTVINDRAGAYENLFVVGHSLGAPIALTSNSPRVAAYSLWDPSFGLNKWAEQMQPTGSQYSISLFDQNFVFGPRIVEDCKKYDTKLCEELSRNAGSPLQVVSAGEGNIRKEKNSYHTFAAGARHDVVAGSDHLFTTPSAAGEACRLTLDWFQRKPQLSHR
jgi:pimeloyl-ACP methyl ester carboxylesterase